MTTTHNLKIGDILTNGRIKMTVTETRGVYAEARSPRGKKYILDNTEYCQIRASAKNNFSCIVERVD